SSAAGGPSARRTPRRVHSGPGDRSVGWWGWRSLLLASLLLVVLPCGASVFAPLEDSLRFRLLLGGGVLGRRAAARGGEQERAADGEDAESESCPGASRRHRSRTPWSAAPEGPRRGWSRSRTRPGRRGT